MNKSQFDLSSVRFIKRLTIGSANPNAPASDEENQATLDLLNRCLNEVPRGYIIGLEKNFAVFNLGEHQTVLQWLVYHIGFVRKPLWL